MSTGKNVNIFFPARPKIFLHIIHLQKWQILLPDNAPPLSFFQPFLLKKSPQKNAQQAVAALWWVAAGVVPRAMALVVAVVVMVARMMVDGGSSNGSCGSSFGG
jgi:hypothetical protein